MSRIDFGRCFFENVEKLFCLCFCMCGLGPSYAAHIHVYADLFLHMQDCSLGFACMGMGLRMRSLVCIHGL